MELQTYLENLKGKKIAVIGLGVSNLPLVAMLARSGLAVIACDKKSYAELGEDAKRLEDLGVTLRLGEGYLDNLEADLIFRTPGMRPDVPALLAAKARGAVITSEMEVFFQVCPCPIIGVTGSDGKTTTTSIIAEFLKAAGKRVYLGGNIGHPLLCDVNTMLRGDVVVVELSSFQLMEMPYSPHIAVVTNLAPNHLDVHRDFDEYVDAKENIIRHQSSNDIAVFNCDNAITARMSEKARGEIRGFSKESLKENGVFLRGDVICQCVDGRVREILHRDDILLAGMHNVENYMAAIAAVMDFVDKDTIIKVARSFQGVEHRMEFVRELHGVRYYNDSIATSPTRTVAGLRAMPQKVILIAGGYDKQIPFAELLPEVVDRVKFLILCGATAQKIYTTIVESETYQKAVTKPKICFAASLEEAVLTAAREAEAGDIVTLSPACAAFDSFKNFAERGRIFKALVHGLE